MFTDMINPIVYIEVVAIGGKDLIPNGFGTVRWFFTDDFGQLHTNKFKILI